MTPSPHRIPLVGLLLLLTLLASTAPAEAQKSRRITRPPSELLAAFESGHLMPDRINSAASIDIGHVLAYPGDYPPSDLEAFLDGLERLALTADSSRVRATAAYALSRPGTRDQPHPGPGTMARLERIYHCTNEPLVRSVVISGMADLAERPQALAFLERLAIQQPEEADFPGSAEHALATLVAMDDEGRVVLKRLHETGAVRDPEARYKLSVLASRGYRIF